MATIDVAENRGEAIRCLIQSSKYEEGLLCYDSDHAGVYAMTDATKFTLAANAEQIPLNSMQFVRRVCRVIATYDCRLFSGVGSRTHVSSGMVVRNHVLTAGHAVEPERTCTVILLTNGGNVEALEVKFALKELFIVFDFSIISKSDGISVKVESIGIDEDFAILVPVDEQSNRKLLSHVEGNPEIELGIWDGCSETPTKAIVSGFPNLKSEDFNDQYPSAMEPEKEILVKKHGLTVKRRTLHDHKIISEKEFFTIFFHGMKKVASFGEIPAQQSAHHTANTTGGMSGGPVVILRNSRPILVGLHCGFGEKDISNALLRHSSSSSALSLKDAVDNVKNKEAEILGVRGLAYEESPRVLRSRSRVNSKLTSQQSSSAGVVHPTAFNYFMPFYGEELSKALVVTRIIDDPEFVELANNIRNMN